MVPRTLNKPKVSEDPENKESEKQQTKKKNFWTCNFNYFPRYRRSTLILFIFYCKL